MCEMERGARTESRDNEVGAFGSTRGVWRPDRENARLIWLCLGILTGRDHSYQQVELEHVWEQGLSHGDVLDIYGKYRPEQPIEVGFDEAFGAPLPETLNTGHRLTIVAADLDSESQRIVEYLATYDVPLNVVFFRYFVDDGREYLARTWLIDHPQEAGPTKRPTDKGEAWSGRDWYVTVGDESGTRTWTDARAHGFVSAGGGNWYTRTLEQIPVGARVWACSPRSGYVGVGTTTGAARRLSQSELPTSAMTGSYAHESGEEEWIIPVTWDKTVPLEQAVWEKGMFKSGNPACRLRSQFTLDLLRKKFSLPDSEDGTPPG